jgi:hypothetical protein
MHASCVEVCGVLVTLFVFREVRGKVLNGFVDHLSFG